MRKLIVAVLIAFGLIGGMTMTFAPSAEAGQHQCKAGSGC